MRNLGTPVFPAALFGAMLQEFEGAADTLTVFAAESQWRACSPLLQGTVYPYWGGGTHAARALRANDAMYFALMRHARARGMTRFDFGRSKAGNGGGLIQKIGASKGFRSCITSARWLRGPRATSIR